MKIILSIKPEFADEIFSGRKKYEYRKKIFTKEVKSVIVYSTMPVGKFVGEFTIEKIVNGNPDAIWEKTKNYSGITKEFFEEYFSGRDNGYALKISTVKEYEKPIDPFRLIKSFVAPQSFKYITEEEFESWEEKLAW